MTRARAGVGMREADGNSSRRRSRPSRPARLNNGSGAELPNGQKWCRPDLRGNYPFVIAPSTAIHGTNCPSTLLLAEPQPESNTNRAAEKMPTTLKEFESVWPRIVADLQDHCRQYKLPQQSLDWFTKVPILLRPDSLGRGPMCSPVPCSRSTTTP